MSDGSSDVCSSDLLVDFAATANVQRLWSVKVGEGEGRLGSRQAPAIADGHVYAAALEGGVGAWDLQSGSALWRTESELRDRKSVVEGQMGSVRVELGGRRCIKKKHKHKNTK